MSGLYWTAGMRFLGQGFSWAVTIVVIRLLSPADYGLMGLAGVFISFFAGFSEMGLGAAIIQRRDLKENDLKAIFGFLLIVNCIICISLSVAAPFIANFYNEQQLIPIIWFMSSTFLLSGFSILPRALLLREQNHRKVAIVDFLGAFAGSMTTLILAWHGKGVMALVAGVLSIRIVTTVGMHLMRPYIQLPQFRLKGMMSIFIFSGNYTLSSVLWYLHSSAVATLIIGKVMGKEVLGIYEIALYMACLPMDKITGIINQVAFSAFSSIQEDIQLAGTHYLKAVRILSVFSFPVFWGISCLSTEIIAVFLGPKWVEAALPLQIIALVIPLRMVRNMMSPALFGLGYSKIVCANETIGVVLMASAFYVASRYGLTGVSFVWLFAYPLVFILSLPPTAKALKLRVLDVVKGMFRPALAGLVMIIMVELTRRMFPADYSMVVRMVVCIVVGAFVYLAVAVITNRRGLEEVMGLLRK